MLGWKRVERSSRAAAGEGQVRKRRVVITLTLVAALLVAVNVYVAYVISGQNKASSGTLPRPSGIPANVSTSLASLMELSPLGGTRAPGFTLTDQRGRTVKLSALRGKVVVLEFMDPHCTDICPIVSQEFIDAYTDLGPLAGKVVFAAINVNSYHATVHDMAVYSAAHRLTTIPGWHFLTGQIQALRAAWRDYHIAVQAPNPNADIIHTSAVYFIDPGGRERFVAAPMADHKNGTAYLPLSEVASWGHGIAALARDLAR
jgi:cytochrome oxidase Cu insertion factor (SCO1/SenC/PrrC family)